MWLDTEWDQFKHGAEKATWTLAGVLGWRVNEWQDWAVRLKLPFAISPYDWSIGTRYKAKIDFENGDRWTHTIDLGVAKRLSNIPIVLSATLEKDLDGGAKKFQVNFTITCYFKR
jgi:hypothetical protein